MTRQLFLLGMLIGYSSGLLAEVLDACSISRLELIDGTNVLNQLAKTKTNLGYACLEHLFTNPAATSSEIYRRQRIVRGFGENRVLRSALIGLLAQFGQIEEALLTLWKKDSIPSSIARLYPPQAVSKLVSQNQLPWLLESFRALDNCAMLCLVPIALLHLRTVLQEGTWQSFRSSLRDHSSYLPSMDLFYSSAKLGTALIGIPFTLYESYQHFYFVNKSVQRLRSHLRPLGKAFSLFQEAANLLCLYRDKIGNISEAAPLYALITEQCSCKMTDFVNLLQKKSVGSLMTAESMLRSIGEELIPLLVAMGNLDAYVSLGTLMAEQKYCLVQCLPTQEPDISVTGCWSAVGQTECTRIATALICAQAFGIAPATSFACTPFHHICCSPPHDLGPDERAFVLSIEEKRHEEISLWTTEQRIVHAGEN